nr:quinol:electron acceptor oxidoreductase subunit ActD [Candidatus Karelsulcia muelleri]
MKNIIYALYDNDEIILKEIKRMNLLKIKIKNIYSPFPIHGIKKYIKHLKSPFNIKIFYYGLFGFLISSLITWYSMILDWPQNIGGKPRKTFL